MYNLKNVRVQLEQLVGTKLSYDKIVEIFKSDEQFEDMPVYIGINMHQIYDYSVGIFDVVNEMFFINVDEEQVITQIF